MRASFGYTGNPNVAANAYIQGINQTFQYTFGNSTGSGGVVGGAAPSRSYNPDIKWEKNEQFNIGFDATAFSNRVNMTVDLYQRRSKDLILYVAPPLFQEPMNQFRSILVPCKTAVSTSASTPKCFQRNPLTGRPAQCSALIRTRSFHWAFLLPRWRFRPHHRRKSPYNTGLARHYFYGFVTEGIFQSYEEIANHAVQTPGTDPTTSTAPGDIKFKDLNGDG